MLKTFTKLLGGSNDSVIKKLQHTVDEINALEPDLERLSDDELRAKRQEFIDRYQDGEELNDLLPEAFAAVREVSKRTLGMRHFDVQLIGGIVLHEGKISEMKTGEGKTLVATLPMFLDDTVCWSHVPAWCAIDGCPHSHSSEIPIVSCAISKKSSNHRETYPLSLLNT